MNVWMLIALSIAALSAMFIASAILLRSRIFNINTNTSGNFNTLAAEDLLGVVIGVPLDEIVNAGDKVEIVIKINSHPIAGCEYGAKRWCGRLKLNTKMEG